MVLFIIPVIMLLFEGDRGFKFASERERMIFLCALIFKMTFSAQMLMFHPGYFIGPSKCISVIPGMKPVLFLRRQELPYLIETVYELSE